MAGLKLYAKPMRQPTICSYPLGETPKGQYQRSFYIQLPNGETCNGRKIVFITSTDADLFCGELAKVVIREKKQTAVDLEILLDTFIKRNLPDKRFGIKEVYHEFF